MARSSRAAIILTACEKYSVKRKAIAEPAIATETARNYRVKRGREAKTRSNKRDEIAYGVSWSEMRYMEVFARTDTDFREVSTIFYNWARTHLARTARRGVDDEFTNFRWVV